MDVASSAGRKGGGIGAPEGSRLGRALAAALAVLVIGSLLAAPVSLRQAPPKVVRLAPDDVILSTSDIPDTGWGLSASGTNGSGVWRLFDVHNELLLGSLNVTLWVEEDAVAASKAVASIVSRVGHPTQDGGVSGADASVFWSYDSGVFAGMLVRRYNVVFLLLGDLETSFALTRSNLQVWAGWQLSRIEAAAG